MAETVSVEIKNAYSSICEKFEISFNSKDSIGLAEVYTENAKIFAPNMDIVEGRPAIQQFWQGALEMGIKSFKGVLSEAENLGNTGYLIGTYTVSGQEGQMLDQGKFISILKKENDQWKVYRDIYNSNIPLK